MKEKFAIIHEMTDSQCLIQKWYDPEQDNFNLSLKFWCVNINGFITVSMGWDIGKEADYNRTFDEFKSKEKVEKWIAAFESKQTAKQ